MMLKLSSSYLTLLFIMGVGCSGVVDNTAIYSAQDTIIHPTTNVSITVIPNDNIKFTDKIEDPFTHRKISLGFYNCENLFDTKDDIGKDDAEFSPNSVKKYTTSVYQLKLQHTAKVIAAIERAIQDDTMAFVGLAEVENLNVLKDLVKQEGLRGDNWQIIHQESSDPRGIDAALLYRPHFLKIQHYELLSPFSGAREVLYVKGLLLNTPTHIFVNHWTSRVNGGEQKRKMYAQMLKEKTDRIIQANEDIIIMGDLNDNPDNTSVQSALGASDEKRGVTTPYLFNPFFNIYLSGRGSLVYQSAWDLFDQIILLQKNESTVSGSNRLRYLQAKIVNEKFLLMGTPPIPDAPKRFYNGNFLVGGYSDHLPVVVQVR